MLLGFYDVIGTDKNEFHGSSAMEDAEADGLKAAFGTSKEIRSPVPTVLRLLPLAQFITLLPIVSLQLRYFGGSMSAVQGKKTGRVSGRQRQWSAKIKALGKEARNEAIRKRLGVLESDNWEEEEKHRGQNNDEDYVDDGGDDSDFDDGPPKKKKSVGRTVATSAAKAKRFKAPPVKSFAVALEAEHYDRYPAYIPTYVSISAQPSVFPGRQFCYICGNSSHYTCPNCGLRFCKIRCDEEHKETRCLKFLA